MPGSRNRRRSKLKCTSINSTPSRPRASRSSRAALRITMPRSYLGTPHMTLDDLRIETPRLILRVPRAEDLDPWAAMMSDEGAAHFIGGVMPRSVTWRGLMTMIGSWHAMGFAMFSVIEKSSGRWVGRLGPWMPEGWPGPEVGWAIVRDCWGRGYAPEGAIAATNWAFDTLGWDRVIHSID